MCNQYTFCIARNKLEDSCTPPSGLPLLRELTPQYFSGANENQLALLRILWTVLWINDITSSISNGFLKASSLTINRMGGDLSTDQWIQELVFAESFAMAGVQLMLTDYAVGPEFRSKEAANYTVAPSTGAEHALCRALKMRKAGGFA